MCLFYLWNKQKGAICISLNLCHSKLELFEKKRSDTKTFGTSY